MLKHVPNLVGRLVGSQKLLPLLLKDSNKGGLRTACSVTRTTFQKNRPRAINRLFLEALYNRAGFDCFLRKQISRAEKNADLRASLCEWRGHRRDHRRRHIIVNSTREKNMTTRDFVGVQRLQ